MELSDAITRSTDLRRLYERLETQRYGRPWSTAELALGFVGDVGDLAKLVQAAGGVRNIDDHESRLAHELADCLWSVLVLADRLGVDIESAFERTMSELTAAVEQRLDESVEG